MTAARGHAGSVDAAAGAGRVIALVPAAGRGVRLGADLPKAFVEIAGTAMLTRAVDGLRACTAIDRVIVLAPPDLLDRARALVPDSVTVLAGGAERSDSVRAGLAAVADARHVLVHDAARALVPADVIDRVVAALRDGAEAVVPVVPVADTIKTVDDRGRVTGTPDRARLRAVQTPQGFTAALLQRAHASAADATDDAGLVERLGVTVHTVPGDPRAFKITGPTDLALAEALLTAPVPVRQEGR